MQGLERGERRGSAAAVAEYALAPACRRAALLGHFHERGARCRPGADARCDFCAGPAAVAARLAALEARLEGARGGGGACAGAAECGGALAERGAQGKRACAWQSASTRACKAASPGGFGGLAWGSPVVEEEEDGAAQPAAGGDGAAARQAAPPPAQAARCKPVLRCRRAGVGLLWGSWQWHDFFKQVV